MAGTLEVHGPRDPGGVEKTEKQKTVEIVASGSIAEGVVGAATVVLAILGLAGAMPFYMAAVATIALGAALLFEGGTIAARYSKIIEETSEGQVGAAELTGGLTAETFAGVVGLALGILALLGVAPLVLIPIAVIVFGAGLLIGSGATSRLNDLVLEHRMLSDTARRVAREAVSAAAGTQILVGVGAIVVGILALLGMDPLLLSLVALLGLGVSVLLSGSAVGGKMLGLLHH